MRVATPEEIVLLELLAVELEIARAVSVPRASVSPCDRERPVVLPQRTVRGDRLLVDDDATCTRLGEPEFLGVALGSWAQAELEVVTRQELAGR